MALELPTLRLGLAGFGLEQQEHLRQVLGQAHATALPWELAALADADAFLVNGARTQVLADGTLRVAAGVPAARSVQIDVAAMQRPIAFGQPLPRGFEPEYAFNIGSRDGVLAVLERFEQLLRPLVAQVCLASQILDQERALGSGVHRVESAGGKLLALVDLRGEVGLLSAASPVDFDDAMWTPVSRESAAIPKHFFRTGLANLMWQYALRTTRDVLPARYRTETLYFRRPPRLPQALLQDAHLLLMRELACEPAGFDELQQRTGLLGPQLARELAALYLVGAITSNPRRAAPPMQRRVAAEADATGSAELPTVLGADATKPGLLRRPRRDLTAPAPLVVR